MIPKNVFLANLELAERVRHIDGCVVECGIWRGGMIAAVASLLGAQRNYFLFDSFKGLPPAKEIDGPAAIEWQGNKEAPDYLENCTAPRHFAEAAMALAGATKFQAVEGWFDQTMPDFTWSERIALLRLDSDWYDSTITCLENLFDRVAPGGLIIIDDYYVWDGCSRALHEYLSRRSAIERICEYKSVCYMEKR